MSEHEALMWNIEKDPWLNPSGASVVILDRPVDMDRFRQTLRAGIAKTPRLYQRVVPGFAKLSTPAWVPDAEFDLDAHLREIVLPEPGTERQLFDLAARLYSEPLDRTRPLWKFVAIGGLEGGRGALYTIIHHSVSDGIGQLRMAELYQQLSADEPAPDDVDLEGIIEQAVAQTDFKEVGGDLAADPRATIQASASHVARRQFGIGRRVLGEIGMWGADPSRIGDTVGTVVETVKGAVEQLRPSESDDEAPPSGSPLWTGRSRHRHFEWVRLDLDDVKKIGKSAGGTVNDAFLAGLAEGAYRYHKAHGYKIDTVNSSFVLSTRTDSKAGGNSFTPVPVKLPAGKMKPKQRIKAIMAAVEDAKEQAQRTGGMTGLSGIANLLPTSLITSTARAAAARIDFATSNLRGAPFPVFVSGAEVKAIIAMGPVAGTGANITALSVNGSFDIGIFCDPAAITEPAEFRQHVEDAFADLVDAVS
ncbi:MAG: wax ester/triacylglycerol synthase domain-containing protein [Ilumatobacter sp.]